MKKIHIINLVHVYAHVTADRIAACLDLEGLILHISGRNVLLTILRYSILAIQVGGRAGARAGGRADGRTGGRTGGRADGRTGGRADGRTGRRTDRQTDRQI